MKQPVILKSIWLKVLIAFSFIIAFSVLYSDPNFFVIDGAAKYLSIYSLSKKQISMIYNGKYLDKDFTFHPFSPLFFAEKDNTAEIIYPPAFIYISYLCYRLMGNKGLYIPNLLGVFYFIVFISLICRKMKINENLAWILLISSPVLPYIFMFWEYTLFLGLFLGSVFFLVSNSLKESKYDKIMGGFLAGLALHLRTELMILLVILFIHL
ncbi:MAG: hypothetical protein JXA60_05240, partial [Candidatus Coatesbacteria bacterium]|nr:hypothetical protein [Candidatus Coatesbacteria bacterium]